MKNLSWDEAYQLAYNYYKTKGNLLVPRSYLTESGFFLGKWINNQRVNKKNGKLKEEQIIKLNNIEMQWKIKNNNLTWNDAYDLLKSYYNKYGNIDICSSYITDETYTFKNYRLGLWLNNQRNHYKNNKLSKEQINKLNMLNIKWSIVSQKHSWNSIYSLALQYYNNYNNLNIPSNFITDETYSISNYKLGEWIKRQRTNRTIGKLSEEKIIKLTNIHMNWLIDEKWYSSYILLKSHYEKNGSLDNLNNKNLSKWISYQKKCYKNNKLNDDKIKLLSEMNIFATKDFLSWKEAYSLALKYYEENNNLLIPYSYKMNGYNLGKWISNQRLNYKNNKLTAEQISKLESLGMVWSIKKEIHSWEELYEVAKDYYEKNGNLVLPNSYVTEDGYGLGAWLSNQRHLINVGKINEDKLILLEKIGMISTTRSNVKYLSWNEAYLLACEYYYVHGKLDMQENYVTDNSFSFSNYSLGRWIQNQRFLYKNKKISEERINLLNEIKMVWTPYLTWEENYSLACTYYKEHGNLLVDGNYVTDEGFKLGKWILVQKTFYKKNKLSRDKVELLNKINMVWDLKANKESVKELCEQYNIDYQKNIKLLKRVSYNELYSKLMYLVDNNIDYIDDKGILHTIFYMSSSVLEEEYGISLQELVSKYNKVKRL